MAKAPMLKSRETTEDGGAIWDVILSEGAPANGDHKRPPQEPNPIDPQAS
jgi:hypothetical protein